MSVFARAQFEALVGTLPASAIVHQWGGASVAKVGGKIFAIQSENGMARISLKVSDLAFDMLPERDGIRPAPYMARAKWVQVDAGAMSEDDMRDYLIEAHRLIAARLTRASRAELGLA